MMESKGVGIKDVPKVIKEIFGEENYQKWFDALPQESKDIYGNKIKIVTWYPFKYAQFEPDRVILKLFYKGDVVKMKDYGKAVAKAIFTGVYKFFIRVGKPGFLIAQAGSMASTMMRPVKMEVVDKQEKRVVVRYTEFPDMYESYEYKSAGVMQQILEMSGGKNVNVVLNSSIAKGDQYTEFTCTWE
ncbi:hypothetical protein ACFLZ9_02120 [Patescibacteria group bacterium]